MGNLFYLAISCQGKGDKINIGLFLEVEDVGLGFPLALDLDKPFLLVNIINFRIVFNVEDP